MLNQLNMKGNGSSDDPYKLLPIDVKASRIPTSTIERFREVLENVHPKWELVRSAMAYFVGL